MKVFVLIILNFAMFSFSCSQDALDESMISTRPATVAGTFYPSNPDTLGRMIDEYLDNARDSGIEGAIRAIAVPHAGYVYSGWIAGMSYSAVRGREYDAVIIIGPSHSERFYGASIFDGEGYSTPFGVAEIDRDLAQLIEKESETVIISRNGHGWNSSSSEHSIEVQIPFIQRVLPKVPIVPICMGSQDFRTIDQLAQAIIRGVKNSGKEVLIVASTDLSHFHKQSEAREIDKRFVESFERYDYFKISLELAMRKCEACGGGPVAAAMIAAENLGATESKALHYASSADSPRVNADTNRVVGYFAGLMFEGDDSFDILPDLNEDEKNILKKFAMNGVKKAVKDKELDNITIVPSSIKYPFATFVTIKKDGRLRGCMGHTIAGRPLMDEVEETGWMAAAKDPRFTPLKKAELDEIDFEITILSRFKRIFASEEVEVGKDGVYLRVGNASGLFLPQVAPEQGWDREIFLEQLGRKAGLNDSAYLLPEAELYIFRAVIIE